MKTGKTAILLLAAMFIFGSLSAQKKGKTEDGNSGWEAQQISLQKEVYELAKKYGDGDEAKNALFQLIALDADGGIFKDTLLGLLYNGGMFGNTILLGTELLEAKPEDSRTLSLVALSEQALGMQKEALEHFEKLYELTDDTYYLYQIASTQYAMERFGECKVSINKLLGVKDATTKKIVLTYSQREQQEVSIAAAAYNIAGFLELNMNNEAEAQKLFEKALELQPDFYLAKANLDVILKKQLEQPQTEGDQNND